MNAALCDEAGERILFFERPRDQTLQNQFMGAFYLNPEDDTIQTTLLNTKVC